ncbi:MAG: helix-turn-helix transcriptional regulator [Clostridia bacterium]|nr:helix-turn-helix transcriptional regulator [Clostridia bacterium]
MDICYYTPDGERAEVYEFGHSCITEPKTILPYVRGTYLLHIVIRGVCHFCDFEAESGEAFLISKNKIHSFSVEPGYEHYWFGFDGDFAIEQLVRLGVPIDRHVKLAVQHFEYLAGLLKEAKSRANDNAGIAQSALYSTFPLLSVSNGAGKKESIAQSARRFMEYHYQKPITMEDVAQNSFVTEKYLCFKFKQAYGLPPKQYLLKVRMQRAAALLESTDFKIKEIAVSAGYSSQLAFSGSFKRFFGQSPVAYRETKKQNA